MILLQCLAVLRLYIEVHFTPVRYVMDGTRYRMIGLVDNEVKYDRVVNADKLINEVDGL